MRKVAVSGFLFVFLLAISGSGLDPAVAQVSKKPAAGAAATGVIEITEGKDGKYRFFVRDAEKKLLAMSSPTGFASAEEAKTAIQHLKEIVKAAPVTSVKKKTKE